MIVDDSTTSDKAKERQSLFHNGSLDDLAKEFGVETRIVQALAQRLNGLC